MVERAVQFVEELELVIQEQRDAASAQVGNRSLNHEPRHHLTANLPPTDNYLTTTSPLPHHRLTNTLAARRAATVTTDLAELQPPPRVCEDNMLYIG